MKEKIGPNVKLKKIKPHLTRHFGSSEAYAMEVANESAIKKPKRLTSVVWNHFERVRKADVCYAVCVHCNKKLSGSSNSGTTHLRNHLMRCLKRSNYDVSQLLAAKRRKKDNTLTIANISYDEGQRKEDYIKPTIVKYEQDQRKDEVFNLGSSRFDQERSRLDLARMIILHGYPLAMVEHVGFKVFVKNLQPLFDLVPNSTIELFSLPGSSLPSSSNDSRDRLKGFDKFLHETAQSFDMHTRLVVDAIRWCTPVHLLVIMLYPFMLKQIDLSSVHESVLS
ncbi:zinc finger protein [Theobroma cacao]|nr:zinc finger protein [Theobroma cacao]